MKKTLIVLAALLAATVAYASNESAAELCGELGRDAYQVHSIRKLMNGINWSPLSTIDARRAHFNKKIAEGTMTEEEAQRQLKKDTFVAIEVSMLPAVLDASRVSDIVIQKCLMKSP
jgi:hypothetical protein